MLTKKQLGQTDLFISPLSLGTVKFGRTEQVRYPDQFKLPDDVTMADLIYLARDGGINCLDTAPAYGASEERLGEFFKKNPIRSDFIVSSKVGEQFQQGQSHFDFSPQAITLSIERSLKKLNTDYLDFIFIHSDGNDLAILNAELLGALFSMKKQGKIRYLGMSSKTVEGGLSALSHCDALMLTHNINYTEELSVIQKAHELKKGVFIKKGLGSGHLIKTRTLREILLFLFKEPGISSVILGTINPTHLQEAIQTTQQIFNADLKNE